MEVGREDDSPYLKYLEVGGGVGGWGGGVVFHYIIKQTRGLCHRLTGRISAVGREQGGLD